jgi:hypothetical protein
MLKSSPSLSVLDQKKGAFTAPLPETRDCLKKLKKQSDEAKLPTPVGSLKKPTVLASRQPETISYPCHTTDRMILIITVRLL